MGLTGDFKKLDRFTDRLEGAGDVMENVSLNIAEEMLSLTMDGFRREKNPYNRKWQKKQRKDGRKVLVGKTRRLNTGWHVSESSAEASAISPNVDYAIYHQAPSVTADLLGAVERLMVPDDRGLPGKWEKAMEGAALDVLTLYFNVDAPSLFKLHGAIK